MFVHGRGRQNIIRNCVSSNVKFYAILLTPEKILSRVFSRISANYKSEGLFYCMIGIAVDDAMSVASSDRHSCITVFVWVWKLTP